MNRTLYVTKDGMLRRKDNTLVVRMPDGTSTFAPVESIDDIILMGDARRTVAQAWDTRLDKTISNPETGKRASWRYLVLLEAQKLQRHILDGAGYEPFKYRWQ